MDEGKSKISIYLLVVTIPVLFTAVLMFKHCTSTPYWLIPATSKQQDVLGGSAARVH